MLQNLMVGPNWWKEHPTLLPDSPLVKKKGSSKLAYNINIFKSLPRIYGLNHCPVLWIYVWSTVSMKGINLSLIAWHKATSSVNAQ